MIYTIFIPVADLEGGPGGPWPTQNFGIFLTPPTYTGPFFGIAAQPRQTGRLQLQPNCPAIVPDLAHSLTPTARGSSDRATARPSSSRAPAVPARRPPSLPGPCSPAAVPTRHSPLAGLAGPRGLACLQAVVYTLNMMLSQNQDLEIGRKGWTISKLM